MKTPLDFISSSKIFFLYSIIIPSSTTDYFSITLYNILSSAFVIYFSILILLNLISLYTSEKCFYLINIFLISLLPFPIKILIRE